MSYYPFFRGKQFELICLRENAALIAAHGFTPIIEPVKESAGGLLRALDALKTANANFLVMANPSVGHHAKSLPDDFSNEVNKAMTGYQNGQWIFQIRQTDDMAGLKKWIVKAPGSAIFHQGLTSAKEVSGLLDGHGMENRIHVFGANSSTRYRAAFPSEKKVLLHDGFKKCKNADYPEVELFSELPVTYRDQGVTGFGDYLIVGSDYSEGGGAAYAVAIHATYADPEDDQVLYIRHFISDTNDTPADPAGKFKEALNKLVNYCSRTDSKIPKTEAIKEFVQLHKSGHFPGLGYVKKLSMQHHLEIMVG